MRIERPAGQKLLQDIALCSIDHLAYGFKHCVGMVSLDHCGPKLIVYLAIHQSPHCLLVWIHVFLHSDQTLIIIKCIFHIHRYIIHQALINKLLYHVWFTTISIELYAQACLFFDSLDKGDQISLYSRFSSTNHHPFYQMFPSLQKVEESGFTHQIFHNILQFLWYYKLIIVAIMTSHIASRRKYHGSHFTWIVQQCRFLDSCDFHGRGLASTSVLFVELRIKCFVFVKIRP